jgi:hypothetical protein
MTRLLVAHDGSTAADAAITTAGGLNRLVIAVDLLLGVLIGMFGSLSQRRAEASNRKHAAREGAGRPAPGRGAGRPRGRSG